MSANISFIEGGRMTFVYMVNIWWFPLLSESVWVSFMQCNVMHRKINVHHIRELWVSHLVKEPAELHCIWCACSKVSGVGAVLGTQSSTSATHLKEGLTSLKRNLKTLCVKRVCDYSLFQIILMAYVFACRKNNK